MIECDLCGTAYESRAAALRCCSEQFDDDDLDPDNAVVAPDAHGAPLRCDGGRRSARIDPLVCPRGHHSIDMNGQRFHCQTCRSQGRETRNWDRSEVVDLRTEEPPLADDDPELATDGGSKITTSEDAQELGRKPGTWDTTTCPKCGREWENLPAHLRACDGGKTDE